MSKSGDAVGKTPKAFSAEFVSDRFDSVLRLEGNKPDAKEFTELGSPISPLRIRGAITETTSSSSSSSGSSGKPTPNAGDRKFDSRGERSQSKENSSPRSISGGGRGSSSASSPVANVLPAGNICPSGKIGKMGMMSRSAARKDVLGSGTGNYGHGSILRGGLAGAVKTAGGGETAVGSYAGKRVDPEEATKTGNEHYKKGQFAEALRFYERAVEMCPSNAACRNNRAAALSGLGRLEEAVKECEEAIRLDPAYGKAHHRLSGLYLRLGHVEGARRHLLLRQQPDHTEMLKLQTIERHLGRCAEVRRMGDWKSALREADFVIAAGADSSLLINALRAEAFLRLHHLVEADSTLSKAFKYEIRSPLFFHSKFLGMLSNSYIYFVRAQVEMALGRFENAVESIANARQTDPRNVEVSVMWNNVNSVARARSQGNEFFKSGNFVDACIAYSEGLKYDPSNPVLYCNRAACRSKLGQWERSLEDCNEALRIQPSYTKALLRRAASYVKLEQWIEAVRDYEVLRRELPADAEVAEAFFHAEVALKASRGEEVYNMKFGGEVEKITGPTQLQEAIALTGTSVVYFLSASNHHCVQTTPFVEALCARYPSLNFMKVEITENPAIAKAENVRIVPTVKIYKNGVRVKEMICPTQQVLELSLRHYGI